MNVVKCDRKCQSNNSGLCVGTHCFLGKEVEKDEIKYLIIHINYEQYVAIIENREPRGLFYWIKDGKYIGIDNRTGDAWVEAFDTRKECFDWIQRKFEVSDVIDLRD